jgi:ABC-type lipoprotein release transport system permease subunit
MVRIATAAVAVSIAVMVVTVAIVAGFRKDIRAAISDISADILVTDLTTLYGAEVRPIKQNDSLRAMLDSVECIKRIEPYAMRGCIVRSKSGATGIVVKGESNFAHRTSISNAIIDGKGYEIKREDGYTGNIFTVKANSSLTLNDVIIDGGAIWEEPVGTYSLRNDDQSLLYGVQNKVNN